MHTTDDGEISNFPPGVTEVPCRICGKLVDVTDDSQEWNEGFPPAHRVCANSELGSSFFAPLWVVELVDIWRALQRQEKSLSREKWKEVVDALRDSVTYVNEARPDERCSIRKRLYAGRVLAAVFQMAYGGPPPKGSLIVSAPHNPNVKAAQHREYERRTGIRPKWQRYSRRLATHGR